ncbi:MAG: hypothetical protein JO083_04805 [Candidatus Eremiobacteraeota bacterium]|nr:hypothetical protein [Candidatus Eremiobacteraeota bacterium]
MTTPQPVESVFTRAWELLSRNWIIIVPGIVIGAILGVLRVVLAPPAMYTTDAAGTTVYNAGAVGATILSSALLSLIGLIAYIANQAFTTGMAGAAWQRGVTTLADGFAAFQEDAGRIIITAIGLILLAVVAVVLAIPTIGIALLAFYLFTLYAMPAAIVGNRPGFSSIAESFRITLARFVPTLILGIVIFVITLVATFIAAILHAIPFLGPIVGGILTQIVVAYATLVVVGEYLNLRNTGAIAPPSTPNTPGAPVV